MVDLRNQCIHPTSKKPYITSASGGRQDSPEGNKVCSVLHPLFLYSLRLSVCVIRMWGLGLLVNRLAGRVFARLHAGVRKRGGPEILCG